MLRRAVGGYRRRDHGERDEVAAVDRQTLNLLLRDHRCDCCFLRVHDRSGGDHLHRLGGAGETERDVELDEGAERQLDVLAHFVLETLKRDRHLVDARRKRRDRVAAVGARHRRARLIRLSVGGCHRGARQHRLGRVLDDAHQIRRRRARLRRRPLDTSADDQEEHQTRRTQGAMCPEHVIRLHDPALHSTLLARQLRT